MEQPSRSRAQRRCDECRREMPWAKRASAPAGAFCSEGCANAFEARHSPTGILERDRGGCLATATLIGRTVTAR